MKIKSEKKIKDPIQCQMGEYHRFLEESLFLGNSFFLTGQNLLKTNCKDKTEIEVECIRNRLESMAHK
ncbi:hypothetical protein Lsan_3234 [Legionella santicrucis]|uniref:Uncharacterized protein n=1 Tax=Legionella santicrucis TaxID=45074 RepID=A0A0W0YFW5_9GAMM|nr:hypothetical protein [Legionella santicrucis]KTD55682.1 hypothetical protein Lsan_3234 [Legionella santicrucis]